MADLEELKRRQTSLKEQWNLAHRDEKECRHQYELAKQKRIELDIALTRLNVDIVEAGGY